MDVKLMMMMMMMMMMMTKTFLEVSHYTGGFHGRSQIY